MPIREEKFDQERIDSLRRYLQREADKGRKKDFEIIVDGFKVISRTDDVTEFDDYEQEIKSDTQSISILIYDGPTTNRNNKYTFLMHGEPTLNGIGITGPTTSVSGIGKIIQEKIDAKEREIELHNLKEKLAEKEKELEEAEEYQEILQQQIKDLENGQRQKAIGWSELAGFFVNGYLKQNPHLVKKIPIAGETLAGMLGTSAPIPEMPAQNNNEDTTEKASFEKKQPAPQDAEETGWQLFRQQLQHSFNDEQQDTVLAIVSKLSNEPGQISKVAQLLNI